VLTGVPNAADCYASLKATMTGLNGRLHLPRRSAGTRRDNDTIDPRGPKGK